jgi:hypothetical protein
MSSLDSISGVINSSFGSASLNFSNLFNIGSLLSDLNNFAELADITDTGWVGSDPLYSHFFIMQPALYQSVYIPRNLVKSVTLPSRQLNVQNIKFRGGEISYYKGYTVGDLQLTFYENQEFQVLAYLRRWQAGAVGIGGSYYGLPNDYKYTMYFINNNSLGQPFETLTSKAVNALPSTVSAALNSVEFCGLTILFGCSVKNVSLPASELRKWGAYEVSATFQVDEMVQIPLSADIKSILQILGLQNTVENTISNVVSSVL